MMDELYNENLVDSPDDIEQVVEGGEDRAYESGQFYIYKHIQGYPVLLQGYTVGGV